MPTGTWRRRRPLPTPPGLIRVCPIGECTPAEAELYREGRNHKEELMEKQNTDFHDVDTAQHIARDGRSGTLELERAAQILDGEVDRLGTELDAMTRKRGVARDMLAEAQSTIRVLTEDLAAARAEVAAAQPSTQG